MKIVVLMAFRGDGEGFGGTGWRDRAYTHVLPHIESAGWPVYVADSGHEPFSVPHSYNQAAAMAGGDWDKAIIHPPDEHVDLDQLDQAVNTESAGMVYAFDHTIELTASGTRRFFKGSRTFDPAQIIRRLPEPGKKMPAYSGPRVVTRQLWDRIGGFDTRTVGWGAEDQIFAHYCKILGGPHRRIPGSLYSLFHPRNQPGDDFYAHKRQNRRLWRQIKAITDPEVLDAYLAAR
jgi:hypothetical protein